MAQIKVPKSVRRQPEGNHSCPGGECGVTRMDLVLGLGSAIVSCSGTTGMLLGVALGTLDMGSASQYTNGSRLVENRRPPGEARQGGNLPDFLLAWAFWLFRTCIFSLGRSGINKT